MRKHLWLMVVLFVATIVGGAFIYNTVEGWSIFDSFYFVIITVTTIGYGDLAPVTVGGKLLTMFMAFFGVAFALYILSQMSSGIFKKHVSEKVGEIKRDVRKEEEIKEDIKKTIKKSLRKR